jgi:DNA-binding transcriptional LysR family regulator
VDTRVIDGDVAMIEAMLSERRASVALRPFRPEPADHGLVRHGLWREPFVVLAPTNHPICQNEVIRLEEVARFPVITIGDPFSDPLLGYEASAAMHSGRIEPSVGIVSHQPTTLAAMVRAGHGLGLINALATTMIRLDDLVVLELSGPNLYRDVGLWWHADRPLSRASEAFVDLALAADRPAGTMPISAG